MACDSCRKRKVRCNDARPQCDNCSKRSLPCTYLGEPGPPKRSRLSDRGVSLDGSGQGFSPRAPPHSASRPRDYDPGRLERLESLVHELARKVPVSTETHDTAQLLRSLSSREGTAAESPQVPPAERASGSSNGLLRHHLFRSSQPTEQSRAYLVDTYTYYIHFQPLPLFDPARVSEFTHSSHNKLHQCIQIGVAHLNPESSKDAELVKEMRRSVFDILVEGNVSLDLAQALCVLVLVSIKNEEWIQAQVTLGIVSRIMDELIATVSPKKVFGNNRALDIVRCAQSVYILECILRRSSRDTLRLDRINQIAGVSAATKPISAPRAANAENNPADLGVRQYCLQLFTIWSRTVAYLDTFRAPADPKPWQPGSEYHTIMQELYSFEISLAQEHRVGNLRLEDRTTGELEEHRSYWAPWFTMQFLFHAIQALVNHPLIHITKVGGDLGFRPPSFSQQTADQARLHAGWVTRLVRACQEKHFHIHDPFTGHLVAAVSTVQLFWMDDRSDQIAHEASDCHRTCETFLGTMAERWPHLRNTLRRLELLAQSAAPGVPAFEGQNGRPSTNGQAQPKHSAQLALLLPMFQYYNSSLPLPEKTTPQDTVALPRNLDFLTPLDQAIPSTNLASGLSPSAQGFAADDGMGIGPDTHDLLMAGVNIFDTSDILNTTLLDGSLWPGQL
ncbi:hypothetical protein K461DRAFT_290076 [Myriangium duriaei CBS 260.36]|uniref:Zn(2)-C6 fungal-type domain-containing protein n=1 Tax=Myriangium duriaei CBS 260.36 TaxID=1168546 RepID=A0A9P4MQ08_9PEZI|nr:hypothetical protein K461DRAFT_290076 [Myriangium duriaei CBS 260.36]